MRTRWCHRCKRDVTGWYVSVVGRVQQRRCSDCGSVTLARRPSFMKHASADQRTRKVVKARDGGICRKCGERGTDGAHIFPKGRYRSMRQNPDNLLWLCRRDHQHFHAHPAEFRDWLQRNVPDLYAQLQEMAR